jgi:hypothetical protein
MINSRDNAASGICYKTKPPNPGARATCTARNDFGNNRKFSTPLDWRAHGGNAIFF